jgi:hypothetical protein
MMTTRHRLNARHLLPLLALAALLPSLGGCEELLGKNAQMPTISYKQTALVKSPSITKISHYFCGSLCGAAVPAKSELEFDFETTFSLQNPNDLPIPTLAMLLAVDVYPDDPSVTELGAVCVSFCDPTDATCQSGASQSACDAGTQNDITSWADVAERAKEGLVNLASGQSAYPDNDKLRYIEPGATSDIKVVYSFGIDPLLSIMGKYGTSYAQSYLSGAPIEIPYGLKGTVWVNLPYNFGRFGLSFGPTKSSWNISTK